MASKLAGGEVVLDHGTFKANQPPLAPKRKLKIDRKKSNVEWQWAPFTNQAREDGLVRRPLTFRRPYAIDATRLYQTRSWVVSFSNLSRFVTQIVTRYYPTQV